MSVQFDSYTTLTVEISFDSPSVTNPTWVDVTSRAQTIEIQRGRSYELDDFQAGSATVRLDNRDRMLDPTYSGAYSGLLPMARLRIVASKTSDIIDYDSGTSYDTLIPYDTEYPLFYGFISGFPTTYEQPYNAYTVITAYDPLSILNRDVLQTTTTKTVLTALEPDAWYAFEEQAGSTVIYDQSGNDYHGTYGTQGTITFQSNPVPFTDTDGKSVDLSNMWVANPAASAVTSKTQFNVIDKKYGLLGLDKWSLVVSWTTENGGSSENCVFSTSWDGAAYPPGSFFPAVVTYPSRRAKWLSQNGTTITYYEGGNSVSMSNANFATGTTNRMMALIWSEDFTTNVLVRSYNAAGTLLATEQMSIPAPTTVAEEIWIGANRGQTYDIWTGVDSAPGGLMGTVIDALRGRVDELAIWKRTLTVDERTRILEEYAQSWPNELTGNRIDRVLDDVNWPNDLRDVDGGVFQVVQGSLGTDALSYLKSVVNSETGLLYSDGNGKVVFRDRNAILQSGSNSKFLLTDLISSAITITYNDPNYQYNAAVPYQGALPYEDIQYGGYDDRLVYNIVNVNYNNGVSTFRDASSYDRYRWRRLDLDTLLVNQADAVDTALFALGRYASPQIRVASVTINPRRDASFAWPLALAAEIGQVVTVVRTPVQSQPSYSIRSVVEGVTHSINASEKSWKTTFRLSPSSQINYLRWDDPVRGRFDQNRWGP